MASQHRHCCVHVNTSPPAVRFAQQYQRSGVQDEIHARVEVGVGFLGADGWVSAPGIPRNGARRYCIPNLRRVVQRLRFSMRKSSELFRDTPLRNVMMKKSFLGILRYIQAGVSFDYVEGQGLYCSRPPGSNAYVSAPVCGFLLQLFLFFNVCFMTQAPAFIMLVGRGSDLCLLKT